MNDGLGTPWSLQVCHRSPGHAMPRPNAQRFLVPGTQIFSAGPIKYVVVIRNPLDRIISQFRYRQVCYLPMPSSAMAATVASSTAAMNVMQCPVLTQRIVLCQRYFHQNRTIDDFAQDPPCPYVAAGSIFPTIHPIRVYYYYPVLTKVILLPGFRCWETNYYVQGLLYHILARYAMPSTHIRCAATSIRRYPSVRRQREGSERRRVAKGARQNQTQNKTSAVQPALTVRLLDLISRHGDCPKAVQ